MHRYLYLLRHAESKEKQVGQDDHERKLTPRGMREALLIGTYLFKEKTSHRCNYFKHGRTRESNGWAGG